MGMTGDSGLCDSGSGAEEGLTRSKPPGRLAAVAGGMTHNCCHYAPLMTTGDKWSWVP